MNNLTWYCPYGHGELGTLQDGFTGSKADRYACSGCKRIFQVMHPYDASGASKLVCVHTPMEPTEGTGGVK